MQQSAHINQSSKIETIQEQKEIALLLLSKLSFVDPNSMLAGGAVRDWRHGNDARDLDFYLKAPNHNQEDIEYLLQKLGCISIKKLEKNTDNVYKELPYVSSVWDAYYNNTRLNFTFLEDTFKGCIPYLFSNSLCKCYMKKDGEITYLSEFETCVFTKMVLVRRGYGESHPHIQKVKVKYPEYQFYYQG